MLHTPLFANHQRAGASLINLKGVARPVEYVGHVLEHLTTRKAVSLCDVSHMGELLFEGPDAEALLQRLLVGNVAKMSPGRVMYSAFCNEDGHVLDDLVLMRLGPERFLMVVNVTMINKDFQWVLRHAKEFSRVVVEDVSVATALMALQGPQARETLQKVVEADLTDLAYYNVLETRLATHEGGCFDVIISRTGYTGELGYEVCAPRAQAPFIWDTLMRAGRPLGIVGQGVAARESLRTEAGLLLNGNDMDGKTTPWEAGLGWLVDLDVPFTGRDALAAAKERGPGKCMVGLVHEGPGTMRYGQIIRKGGQDAGIVTSGPVSAALTGGRSLGLGYVRPELAVPGTELGVAVPGRELTVTVTKLPFIRRRVKDTPTERTLSPFGLRFLNEHLWVRPEADGWTLGLTEYAQFHLGDVLAFTPLPEGTAFKAGEALAYLDAYTRTFAVSLPVSGVVLGVPDAARARPEHITRYPYHEQGLLRVRCTAFSDPIDFPAYLARTAELESYAAWSVAKRTV